MRCASTSATAQAMAYSRMRGASSPRRSGVNFLESSRPTMRRLGFRITAAATTGPNNAPRPASSIPAMRVQPSCRAARSKREEQRRLISSGILARPANLARADCQQVVLHGTTYLWSWLLTINAELSEQFLSAKKRGTGILPVPLDDFSEDGTADTKVRAAG